MKRFLSFWRDVLVSFYRDDCFNLSAVIAFFAILSAIPLTIIAISLMAHVLGAYADLMVRLRELAETLLPGLDENFVRIAGEVTERKGQMSTVSVGMLLILSSVLFTSLEKALDRVFRTEKHRNFFHSRLVAIGFIFLSIALLCVPGLIKLLQEVSAPLLGEKYFLPPIFTGDKFFYFVTFGSFVLSVVIIPRHKVQFRFALVGAMSFTLLAILARIIFHSYISFSWSRYNLVYGSLTALIALVLWIYYLVNIYLLCAEIVARLQERFRPVIPA